MIFDFQCSLYHIIYCRNIVSLESVLNGRWVSYSEYYTDHYWNRHPRGNMNFYAKSFATTIEIEHRQYETIFRTG